MKKAILILLSLVLICTMCIGFVACDEENIDLSSMSLFTFATYNEFSFGKFNTTGAMQNGYRFIKDKRYSEGSEEYSKNNKGDIPKAPSPYYDTYSVLLLNEDLYFDDIIEEVQAIYDANIDAYIEQNQLESQNIVEILRQQQLSNCFERKASFSYGTIWLVGSDSLYEQKTLKEKRHGDYTYEYSALFSSDAETLEKFGCCNMEFVVEVRNSIGLRVGEFVTIIQFFWYPEDSSTNALIMEDAPHALFVAMNNLTEENLYELGKPYFDIMEEVVDTWLEDPRGQAYVTKYEL